MNPGPKSLPREDPVRNTALAEIARTFMEERNIRWGELTSGMLIVGSAIGLVISLWSSLQAIPHFPVLLFMLVTISLHLAGKYTLTHWKLESTSRGLLIISTLLVPLTQVAGIALVRDEIEVGDASYLFLVTTGLIAATWVTWSSARILLNDHHWVMLVPVLGSCIGQLLVSRLMNPDAERLRIMLLGSIPVFSYLAGTLGMMRFSARSSPWTDAAAQQIFRVLGISFFSMSIPLILMLNDAGDSGLFAAALAPLISLSGITALGIGLVVQQRSDAADLASWKTAGTSVAVSAAMLMVGALIFAWPQPDLLIEIGVMNSIALTISSNRARIALLHVPAALSATFSLWLGVLIATGALDPSVTGTGPLVSALLLGRSSFLLCIFASILSGIAWRLRKGEHRNAARAYFGTAGGLAVTSLLVAVYSGFISGNEANWATPVLLMISFALFITAFLIENRRLATVACLGLLTGWFHAINLNTYVTDWMQLWQIVPRRPWIAALLVHAITMTLMHLGAVLRGRREETAAKPNAAGETGLFSAIIAAGVALPASLIVERGRFFEQSGYLGLIGIIWLLASTLLRNRVVLSISQCILTVTVVYLVQGRCEQADWWQNNFLDMRSLQWHLIILTVTGFFWVGWDRIKLGWEHDRNWRTQKGEDFSRYLRAVSLVGLGCLVFLGLDTQLNLLQTSAAGLLQQGFQWLSVPGWPDVALFLSLVVAIVLTIENRPDSFSAWSLLAVVAIVVGSVDQQKFLKLTESQLQQLALLGHGMTWTLWTVVLGLSLVHLRLRRSADNYQILTFVAVLLAPLLSLSLAARIPVDRSLLWSTGLMHCCGSLLMAWTSKTWKKEGHTGLCGQLLSLLMGRPRGRVDTQSDDFDEQSRELVRLHGDLVRVLTLALLLPMILVMIRHRFSVFEPLPLIPDSLVFCGPLILVLLARLPILWQRRNESDVLGWSALCTGTVIFVHGLLRSSESIQLTIECAQWILISLASVGTGWNLLWRNKDRNRQEWKIAYRSIHTGLVCLIVGCLSCLSMTWNIMDPTDSDPALTQIGQPVGYISIVSVFLMAVSSMTGRYGRQSVSFLGLAGIALVGIFAATMSEGNSPTHWVGLHAIQVGMVGLAFGMALIQFLPLHRLRGEKRPCHDDIAASPAWPENAMTIWRRDAAFWVAGTSLFLVILGWSRFSTDPEGATWSQWCVLAAAASGFVMNLRQRKLEFAILTLGFACSATTMSRIAWWLDQGRQLPSEDFVNLGAINLLTAAVLGLFWSAADVVYHVRTGKSCLPIISRRPLCHAIGESTLATWLILKVFVLINQLGPNLQSGFFGMETWIEASLAGCLSLLFFIGIWNPNMDRALIGLFRTGLGGILMMSSQVDVTRQERWVLLLVGLTSYTVLTTDLSLHVDRGLALLRRFGAPRCHAERRLVAGWVDQTNTLSILTVITLAFPVVFVFDALSHRVTGSMAAILSVFALGFRLHYRGGPYNRTASLLLGALTGIQFSWAFMEVEPGPHANLHRMIHTLVILCIATGSFGGPLPRVLRQPTRWFHPVQRAFGFLTIASLICLAVVLLAEWGAYQPDTGTPLSVSEIGFVAAVLILLVSALISFALLPGRDPLGLTESGRSIYVYAAELVLVLLFVHFYNTVPQLFSGFLTDYWPYVVMALAFAGASAGELLQRMRLKVLAEPLERTSTFLPLLPAIAIWTGHGEARLSAILFLCGLLYAMMSMWSGSYAFRLLGALFGHGALWSVLSEQGVSFLSRPQLWVIPPAISVLVGAHWNRKALGPERLTSIRYGAVLAIYTSSTAEIFVRSASDLWSPMILAGISVVGVLMGILLKIRAFIYTGSSFLLLSMMSMVWNASQRLDHVWPWWVFGIVLGTIILIVFGLFEKKRNEMEQLVSRFRDWDA